MVSLTESAVEHTKQALTKRGKGLGIRVGVKHTGCSGFAYTLEYIDQLPDQLLLEFKSGDIKVFVDQKDHILLNGLTLDYVKKGLSEGFEFINPNETGRCGCGESFKV